MLCPTINGVSYWLCGQTCYNSYEYMCAGPQHTYDAAASWPIKRAVYHGPVSLTAVAPGAAFNGLPVNAIGGHMFLGAENTARCPSPTVPARACPSGNATLLRGNELAVMVPGGQHMYLQANGAWAYTAAWNPGMHSRVADDAGVAYAGAGGGYFGPNGTLLVACPTLASEDVWRVYANLTQSVFASACTAFFAAVQTYPANFIGAWEY